MKQAILGDRRGPHGGDQPQQRPACGKTGPARGCGAAGGGAGRGRGGNEPRGRGGDQLALPQRRGDAVRERPPAWLEPRLRNESPAHTCAERPRSRRSPGFRCRRLADGLRGFGLTASVTP